MGIQTPLDEKIREMVRSDSRYPAAAYHFVFEALDFAMLRSGRHRRRGVERHLTVPELLESIRDFAIAQYGPLSRVVLETLGVFRTEDLGEIVFALVGSGLLNKQETDTREQFRNGFSFREAFDEAALVHIHR